MLKLLLFVLPLLALLICCWYFSSLRSLLVTLLLTVVAIAGSIYASHHYGVTLTEFIFLGHDYTSLTFALIITLLFSITGLVQLLHLLKK